MKLREWPLSTIAHLSLAEYDRIVDSGLFDGKNQRRIELIHGELRELTPIGPAHEDVVDRLTEWSYEHVPMDRVRIRTQHSIGLRTSQSVPQPDIAWVAQRDYSLGRPTAADVFLMVEVAEGNFSYDRGEKADLYAAAGIADYWVVNLPEQSIEVRRDPANGRYRTLRTYTGDEELRPLSVPEIVLRPAALWAAG
jgi:Uma2 family endonuclease